MGAWAEWARAGWASTLRNHSDAMTLGSGIQNNNSEFNCTQHNDTMREDAQYKDTA